MNDVEAIKKYVRAANYISAAQIYLQNNFLLNNRLTFADIKPRLLGHWGTCPGINFLYANLNFLIKKYNFDSLFILGPGHGFPALQANLFLEGTLGKYYPLATQNEAGFGYICKNFSWPYGFPSHSNPGAPGVILEGGELGYSLSTAYGSVLDNPDLITFCLIGDGEAETGPLSASWHLSKLINPARDGAVLPILHLNGYKISGPTFFGRMSKKDLKDLFSGYGYEPMFISGKNIYEKAQEVLDEAYRKIKKIQDFARSGILKVPARFPMIIMETPKGWTGIKKLHDQKIEGNCLSHQVTAPLAKTEKVELNALESWLESYEFSSLFDGDLGFSEEVLSILPSRGKRLGESKHALGGEMVKKLILPSANEFAEDARIPGTIGSSSMRRVGAYLNKVFEMNKDNFRLMSPDETYSNKLDEVFRITKRVFGLPIEKWDKDLSKDGRVMECLSEHNLQGLLQGYVLTGRHAVFASYEAFIQIVSSMVDQYAKFLSVARETHWRGEIPSLNYILTSSGWRQEHNGFSHQNPGFIDGILKRQGSFANVYFPPDGNSALAVIKKMLESRSEINLLVAGKTQEPRWLTPELAERELEEGAMIWDFASDENPDVVLVGVGDYLTKEALAAIDLLKWELPELRLRFVNIMHLSAAGIVNHNNSIQKFYDLFTKDKPVIFNFHGYPQTLKQMLFDTKEDVSRFSVHGYIENGSTTTPFDMQVRNRTSRYHLVREVFNLAHKSGKISEEKMKQLDKKYSEKLEEHWEYIKKHGVDMDEIENWQWKRNI